MFTIMRNFNMKLLSTIFSLAIIASGLFIFNNVEAGELDPMSNESNLTTISDNIILSSESISAPEIPFLQQEEVKTTIEQDSPNPEEGETIVIEKLTTQNLLLNLEQSVSSTEDTVSPTLEEFYVSAEYLSPVNADNSYDTLIIDIKYSEAVKSDINILNSEGVLVKSIYSSNEVTNPTSKIWDGKDTSGVMLPDGIYTIQILGVDMADNLLTGITTKNIIIDNTAPTIRGLAPDQIFEATGILTSPTLEIPLVKDINGTISNARPSSFPLGLSDVNWVINDAADNITSSTSKITITDTTAPNISGIPDDITVESPFSESQIVNYVLPTAYDLVDGEVAITCDYTSGSYFGMGKTTVSCSAKDKRDNTKTISFSITLEDTTYPIITIGDYSRAITNKTVTVNATTNEGNLNASSHGFTKYGEDFEFIATDNSGNVTRRLITVTNVDQIPPVIALVGSGAQNIEVDGVYTELGATLYDMFDPRTPIVIDSTNIDEHTIGSYTVTYNATDLYGNNAEQKTRTVKIEDTTKPVITLNNGDTIQTIRESSPYIELGATVTDNYDSNVEIKIDSSKVTSIAGEYIVTYNATDTSGNKADEVIRTIKVLRKSSSTGSYVKPAQNLTTITSGQVLGAEKYNFTLLLKIDSKGDEVRELQKFLNNSGFKSGDTDGIFGPITKAAVIKFQIANGLIGDGIVGALTRAILNK